MKTGWIKVDPSALDKHQRTRKKGVHFEVSLSPYDIPEDVRGFYCADRKRFIIEFRYLSEEKTKENKQSDIISTWVGINSGRIYKIQIDVDKMGVDAISVSIEQMQTELGRANPAVETDTEFRTALNRRLFDYANNEVLPRVLADA